ncbi:toxin-antitoxin system HicB family antitoxin [Acinetobacter modestus]|uniref:toxin-antitoxin system HicB family antitoxin n=1 Tax=Acinetobacter modestus TaxID=1776740 RepID=UPI00320A5E35
MNTQVVQLNIRTSQEAKEYLAKKAKEEGRSLNNYVDQLFKRMAKEEKSAGAQL